MISRSIRQLMTSTIPRVQFAFSSHDEPPPTKLSKVKDIVYIITHSASTCILKTDTELSKKYPHLLDNRSLKPSSE